MNFQGSDNATNTHDARIHRQRPRGIVYNFAAYTHEQYETMSKELGLSLTAGQLQSCAVYYGKYEHRDPSLDEIYFIDGFAYAFPESRYAFAIKNFFCDDEYIYRTYSDMMEKIMEIYHHPKLPPPLSIYPAIADIYLERAGKKRIFPKSTEISYVPEGNIFCESFARNTEIFKASSENGGWYITQKSNEKKRIGSTPKNSDVYLLLSAENSGNDINILSDCVRRFDAEGLFIFSAQVGKGGITGAALRIASGISIWTRNIESIFFTNSCKGSDDTDDSNNVDSQANEGTKGFDIGTSEVPPTDMSQCMYSELPFPAVLVRADRASLQYIIARLRSEFPDIKHMIAGEAIRGSRFVFKDNSGGIRLSFDGGFLRSLTAVKYTDMRMNRLPYSPQKLKRRANVMSTQTSDCNIGNRRAIFTRSQKAATSSGYLDGVYTIVDTVCRLAAKGLSYENTEICTHLTLPFSDGTAGFGTSSVPTENYESVSAYIALTAGIYRARAELALRGGNITSFNEAVNCPSVDALGYSVTDKKSDDNYSDNDDYEKLYSAVKGVYLLDVTIDNDGIPDFEELRGLLKYISDTVKENPTVRAYYLGGADIGHFLSERYKGRLEYASGYTPRGSENNRDLVFIVESDSPILGTFVGKIYGNNEKGE